MIITLSEEDKMFYKWMDLVSILQNELKLDVYPGGYSALEWQHHYHYLRAEFTYEKLYGTQVDDIPRELLKKDWGREFYLYKNDFLPKNIGFRIDHSLGYPIRYPNLERALLEYIHDIGITESFWAVDEFYADIAVLDPDKFQVLLEKCISNKVKKIFAFLSEQHSDGYRKEIDFSKINFSTKEFTDYSFGDPYLYIDDYNMKVPDMIAYKNPGLNRYRWKEPAL